MPKDHSWKEDRRLAAHEVSKEWDNCFEEAAQLPSKYAHDFVFGVFNAGPYKGKSLKEIPDEYLVFLAQSAEKEEAKVSPRCSDAVKEYLSK